MDGFDLPAYPGDESTCGFNCGCSWNIEDNGDTWAASWKLGDKDGEHCDGCLTNAANYNPYIMPKNYTESKVEST